MSLFERYGDERCAACSASLCEMRERGGVLTAHCSGCGGFHAWGPEARVRTLIDWSWGDNPTMDGAVYFDFIYTDARGASVDRSHGWFDPRTNKLLQTG
jgi:hypothetical protein